MGLIAGRSWWDAHCEASARREKNALTHPNLHKTRKINIYLFHQLLQTPQSSALQQSITQVKSTTFHLLP